MGGRSGAGKWRVARDALARHDLCAKQRAHAGWGEQRCWHLAHPLQRGVEATAECATARRWHGGAAAKAALARVVEDKGRHRARAVAQRHVERALQLRHRVGIDFVALRHEERKGREAVPASEALDAGLGEEDSVIREQADSIAVDVGKTRDQCRAVLRLELVQH